MDSVGSDKDNEHQPIQIDGANSVTDDDHQHIQPYKTVTLTINGVTKQVTIPLKDGASPSDYHAVIAPTAEQPFGDLSIQASCDPLLSENMGAQAGDGVENHVVVGPTTENALTDESLLSSTSDDPMVCENVTQTVDDTETFDPCVQPIVVMPDDTDTREANPYEGLINVGNPPQEASSTVVSSPITSNTKSDSIIVIPDEPEAPALAVNKKVTTRAIVVPNKSMAKGSTGQTYYFVQTVQNGTMLMSANSGQTNVPIVKGVNKVMVNKKATSQLPHSIHRPTNGPFLQVPPEKNAGQNKSLSSSTNVTSSTTVTSQSSKSLYVGSDGKMYIQLDPNQVKGFQPQPQVKVVGREDFQSSQAKVQHSMAKTVPPFVTRPNPTVRSVSTIHSPAGRPVGLTPSLAVRSMGTTVNDTGGIRSILMTNSPKHAVAYQNARSLLPTVLTVPAQRQLLPTSVSGSKEQLDIYLDANNKDNDINGQSKGRPLKINAIFSLQPPGSSLQSAPLPNTVNQPPTVLHNVNNTQDSNQNSRDLKSKSGLVTGISSKVSNHPKGKLCRRSSLDSEDGEDGDDFVVLAEWEEDSDKTETQTKSPNGEGADQTVNMTLRGTQNATPTQNTQIPSSLGYTIKPKSSPTLPTSHGLLTAIRSQLDKNTERSLIHGISPDSLIPGLDAMPGIADQQVKMTLLHCTSLQQNKTLPPFKNAASHTIPQKYKEQYPNLKRLTVTIERLPLPLGKKKMSVRVGKNMKKFEKYLERRHAAERTRQSVIKSKKKAKETVATPLTKPQLKQHLNTRYLLVKTNDSSYLLPVVLQAPKPGMSASQANLNVVPDKALVSLVQQLGASKGESEASKVTSSEKKTLTIKKEPQSEGYGENPKRSRLKRGTESNDIICVDDHDYGDSAHCQSSKATSQLLPSTLEFVDDDTLTTSSTKLLKNETTGACDDEASVNTSSSENHQSPMDIDPFMQTNVSLNEKMGTFDGEDNISTGLSEKEPAEKKQKLDDTVTFESPSNLSASERVQVLKDMLKQQKEQLDKLLTQREESKIELESLDT